MFNITILKKICPYASLSNLQLYIDPLNKYCENFAINNPLRLRHFIAQIAHESGSFNYVKEIASGQAYEWRKDLGNTHAGDGVKYKGRALIEITGESNYLECSDALFGNNILITQPEILEKPDPAVEVSCYFWWKHGLNEIADTDNIQLITSRINGGFNGIDSRRAFYNLANIYIV